MYGCFSTNEVGADYKTFYLMKESSFSYLSLIISINTVIGVLIFVGLIIHHKNKRKTLAKKRKHESPIYKGNPGSFDEIILEKEMQEEYIGLDIFDNLNKRK